MSKSETKSFTHGSADPFEISFILGGGNQERFSEMGVDVKRDNPNQITFFTEKEENFKDIGSLMDKILENYQKPKRRAVKIFPDEVAFFRGKKSIHLEHVKKNSMVESVFFNNLKTPDGEKRMVEVAVIGQMPCINKFMSELFSSIATFHQRQAGIEELERENPPKENNDRGKFPTVDSDNEENFVTVKKRGKKRREFVKKDEGSSTEDD